MRNAFDWKTEVDRAEMDTQLSAEWGRNDWLRSRLLPGMLLLLVVGLLAALPFSRRQNAALEQQVAAVQSSDRLITQAVLAADSELLLAQMGAGRPQWLSNQRVLVRDRLYFDRAPLALWLDTTTSARSDEILVTLNPEWDQATAITELPYQSVRADGRLESVTLAHTTHYHRRDGRWLAGPAPAGYWGEWRVIRPKSWLRVRFPALDEEILGPIIADIAALLDTLCAPANALGCELSDPLMIEFNPDTWALLDLNESRPTLGRPWHGTADRTLMLPTPTLVGRPVDDAGADALFRGYAAWILLTLWPSATADQGNLATILHANNLVLPPPAGFQRQLASLPAPIDWPDAVLALDCPATIGTNDRWLFDPQSDVWTPAAALRSLFVGGGDSLLELSTMRLLGLAADAAAYPTDVISPDGRWRLYSGTDDVTLCLDRSPVLSGCGRELGKGSQPFWLDNQTFGFLAYADASLDPQSGVAIVISDIDSDTRTIPAAQLAAMRPTASKSFQIVQVAAGPDRPDQLFILTEAGGFVRDITLFRYDIEAQSLSIVERWQDNGFSGLPLQLTGDGRFVTVVRYDFSDTHVSVFDTQSERSHIVSLTGRPVLRAAWSPDEDWLAVADERLLWLIAPAHDFARPVIHEHIGCTSVQWLEP